MHQEHNTPWNSLASHFQFFRDNPHLTPRRTGLFARNLPTQGKSLNHFARILSQTITTFSETERAKYHTTSFDAPTSGALFSDELRDRYPKYLNEENQRIEHWILRAKRGHGYGTFDGDLADILQILFNENQMKTIMMLVHHPQIPVHQLQTLSQGYDSGFSRVMEVGLAAYVMLNLFVATGTLQNGTYLESREYRQLVIMMTECMNSRSATQELRDHHFLGALPEDPVSGLPEFAISLRYGSQRVRAAYGMGGTGRGAVEVSYWDRRKF
ncbi:hypothetical protein H0H81_007604 [Sphagnurus paluster]|uniref:Uncharacterized protein n=1 Tax=Sphagnurus paluster TaxID=117069 RepID=A0A9P7KLN2_9AGAR|nr:hypothetical protein H0H81_007604 [Sphagnurus paluster]